MRRSERSDHGHLSLQPVHDAGEKSKREEGDHRRVVVIVFEEYLVP